MSDNIHEVALVKIDHYPVGELLAHPRSECPPQRTEDSVARDDSTVKLDDGPYMVPPSLHDASLDLKKLLLSVRLSLGRPPDIAGMTPGSRCVARTIAYTLAT